LTICVRLRYTPIHEISANSSKKAPKRLQKAWILSVPLLRSSTKKSARRAYDTDSVPGVVMENEDNKENTNPEGAGWQRAVGGVTPATRVFSIWKELAGVKRWRARPRGTISSPNAWHLVLVVAGL
jgi:hypothetical protein